MEIEIRLESRLNFLTFYAWPRKYKNEALRFAKICVKSTKTSDNFDLLNKLNFV